MTTTLTEAFSTPTPPAEAFRYIADFSNIADWDPGVATSERVGDGPVGLGSRFDLQVRFGGATIPMQYVITRFEPDQRVVLAGTGERITAVDTIELEPDGQGSRIQYQAVLEFRGWLRWVSPLFRSRLDEVGRKAVAGLEAALQA